MTLTDDTEPSPTGAVRFPGRSATSRLRRVARGDDEVAAGRPPGWPERLARATPWTPPAVRTLVVVPHPDDEVLSSGGLIAGLRRRGVEVVVAAVTDGGAAYPTADSLQLARVRRHEQREALEYLGVSRRCIRRLGFTDGHVADEETALAAGIERLVLETGAEFVVAPWTRDHHTDHEACGRAARSACDRLGIGSSGGLFWAYRHTDPDEIPSDALVEVQLTIDDREAKAAALACHRSQTAGYAGASPILSDSDLAPTHWDAEYFVLRPAPNSPGLTGAGTG